MRQLLFSLLIFLFAQSGFAAKGTLLLAHGSMNGCGYDNPTEWEQNITEMIEKVKKKADHPVQIAFGMWNSKCFQKGLEKLKNLVSPNELTDLHVLPIYISSHSQVIEMQKYIFKKREHKPIPIPHVKPIEFEGTITFEKALDYNPHISMILSKRLRELINEAKQLGFDESQLDVILVMHGPVLEQDNQKWMNMAREYLQDLRYITSIRNYNAISLRDDADDQTRRRATLKLRNLAQTSTENSGISLILPLLISSGGIEEGIKERLEGIEYVWTGKALLPDEFFSRVVLGHDHFKY